VPVSWVCAEMRAGQRSHLELAVQAVPSTAAVAWLEQQQVHRSGSGRLLGTPQQGRGGDRRAQRRDRRAQEGDGRAGGRGTCLAVNPRQLGAPPARSAAVTVSPGPTCATSVPVNASKTFRPCLDLVVRPPRDGSLTEIARARRRASVNVRILRSRDGGASEARRKLSVRWPWLAQPSSRATARRSIRGSNSGPGTGAGELAHFPSRPRAGSEDKAGAWPNSGDVSDLGCRSFFPVSP
jgi:hypothetical protein